MASRNGSKKKAAVKGGRIPGQAPEGKLEQPKSPMPPQHQSKPGEEAKLKPRPRYEAPHYNGASGLKCGDRSLNNNQEERDGRR